MITSNDLKRDITSRRLDEMYAEDYYWYLQSPQFGDSFLLPVAKTIETLGSTMLDVGCGEGWLCEYITDVQYTGIDGSQLAINRARAKYPQHEFHVARLERYLYETDHTYATLFFGNVLWCHVKDDKHVTFLQEYVDQLHASYLVIYDLPKLDTDPIDQHFELVDSFDGVTDVEGIPRIKNQRKVSVYRCS